LARKGFLSYPEAVEKLHRPENQAQFEKARSEIAYREIFVLQVLLALRKKVIGQAQGISFRVERDWIEELERKLPFTLKASFCKNRHSPLLLMRKGNFPATVDQMVDRIMEFEEGTRIQLLAPVVRGRKGEYHKLIEDIKKEGYVRIRVDGEVVDVNDPVNLDKNKKHNIEIVVDRLIVRPGIQKRLTDSIETVLRLSNGILVVDVIGGKEMLLSQNFACTECNVSMEEITPRMFSFNNPYGACPECTGLGSLMRIDPDLVIPDKKLSLAQGAVRASGWNIANDESYARMYIDALAKHYNFSVDTPVEELPPHILDIILYGTNGEKIKIEYEREMKKEHSWQASREL